MQITLDHTCTRVHEQKAQARALIRHKGPSTGFEMSGRARAKPGSGSVDRACRSLRYLHALDGLISVPHRADLVVHGLVRQQQLVEDLQRTGPVPDRLQRHDPYEMRLNVFRERWRRCVTGSVGPVESGCARSAAIRESWIANHKVWASARIEGESAPITEPRVLSGRKPRPLDHAHSCQSSRGGAFDIQMKPFIILITTAKQQWSDSDYS